MSLTPTLTPKANIASRRSMGYRRGSRPATLMSYILVSRWCVTFLFASAETSNGATLGISALDNEVTFGGYDARELQTASNQSVVNVAVLFDTANTFDWARQIIDLTFALINDHTDGWHDEIFNDGTIINYSIADPACDETNATRAYWDIRNEWGGIVHGVVGCRYSGASIAVGRITNLDDVTQISPSSTSPKLGDKDDFPLFSRLVGADDSNGEVGAMIAMLRSFGWDRVTILATDTVYAKDYTTAFEELWKGEHRHDDNEPWTGTIAYSSTITFNAEKKVDADSVTMALKGVPTDDPSKNS
ncbi:G-protein coupled receptor [Fragilaria crotonensis]|nr:G-protein coupled receptor [Fragilaria crotonensis]